MQKTTTFKLTLASYFNDVPFWRHPDFTLNALTPAQSVVNIKEYIRFTLAAQLLTEYGQVADFKITSTRQPINQAAVNLIAEITYFGELDSAEYITAMTARFDTVFKMDPGPTAKHQVLAEVNQLVYPDLTSEKVIVMQTQDVICEPVVANIIITKL